MRHVSFTCAMSQSWMTRLMHLWYDSFMCDKINLFVMCYSSFICTMSRLWVRRLIYLFMTLSCAWHDSFMRDMTHSCVYSDSFVRVTQLIQFWYDVTHSYVWHSSFVYVTRLICLLYNSFISVTWLAHMCDSTQFIRVTQHIDFSYGSFAMKDYLSITADQNSSLQGLLGSYPEAHYLLMFYCWDRLGWPHPHSWFALDNPHRR